MVNLGGQGSVISVRDLESIDDVIYREFEERGISRKDFDERSQAPERKWGRTLVPKDVRDFRLQASWFFGYEVARYYYDRGRTVDEIIALMGLNELHATPKAARRKVYRVLGINDFRRGTPRTQQLAFDPATGDLPANRVPRQRGKWGDSD